jgi:ABC-2 type transport system permease protein
VSLVAVTRKDLIGARRSKSLWAVLSLLGGIGVLFGYLVLAGSGDGTADPASVRSSIAGLFRGVTFLVAAVVPIVALTVGYQAIAGERDSGGMAFLLSLPNSRGDVFFGKLVSRALLMTAGVLLLFLLVTTAIVGDLLLTGSPLAVPAELIAGVVAGSVLYAVAFVALAGAVSSVFASRRRAVGGAIGAYFVTVVSYLLPGVGVASVVRAIHTDLLGFAAAPNLYALADFTSPFVAYRKLLNLVLPADTQFAPFHADNDPAWFLSDEFALVVFAAWLVVPTAVGYVRFRRADLG